MKTELPDTGRRMFLTGLLLAFVLPLLLTACAIGSGNSPTAGLASRDQDGSHLQHPSIKVAVLLPLSAGGDTRKVAQALKQAGELALFDFNNPAVQLVPKDTRGTVEGAAAAAQEAVAEGAELIIGPLFARSVTAAAPIAQRARVPMIAFSSDHQVAGNGVYLLSFLAGSDVLRIVSYAATQGKRRFAALFPKTDYGTVVREAFVKAVQATGGEIVATQVYPPEANGMLEPVKEIAALAKKGEPSQIDALFLPAGSDILPALAPLLPYFEIDTEAVKVIGTSGWDYTGVGREKSLIGGWFPAPDPRGWREFTKRYVDTYGEVPPRLASLAYDAVSLAVTLSQNPPGQRFTPEQLTRPSGFAGIDGLFRLRPDGTSERGLAILEVQRFGNRVIEEAPRTFARSRYEY